MSVSFIRVDDRMIHGQTCTRWSLEYPCDGLIAVNNAAAKNSVLKAAYKSASGKKTFVWTLEEFKEKCAKVLASKDNYFLITKNPIDMAKILVEQGFKPGIDTVIIGPCNDRPGTTKLGNNQSITQEEAQALEDIYKAGYNIEFALVKEEAIGNWTKFRGQFGFN
ncbi:MAG: PTS sugar transporter subunit IIB [Eubacteriales bacterium]|nr:PTS sugar transporter subunit IIB [Eubacteriales bacterium]